MDSNWNTFGNSGWGLGQYFWRLGGLKDARDLGAGVQAPAACLEGLQAQGRQAPQGFGVCYGSEGSF